MKNNKSQLKFQFKKLLLNTTQLNIKLNIFQEFIMTELKNKFQLKNK